MLHLNIIKVKTPEEMGKAAADEFEAVIHAKPACVIGLATGSTPLPLYPFKFMIPLAGALVLLQGLAEMVRCVICIRTGEWPERLQDAEESDVVAQQLANSEYVDEEARQLAIEQSKGLKS